MENQNFEELMPAQDEFGDMGSNYQMDVVHEDIEEESRGTI